MRRQLLSINASSLDQRLWPIRARYPHGKRYGTTPACLLKPHISVQTNNCDFIQPGFIAADTGALSGDSAAGSFV